MKARRALSAPVLLGLGAAGATVGPPTTRRKRPRPPAATFVSPFADSLLHTEILRHSLPILASSGEDPAAADDGASSSCSSPSAAWLRSQLAGVNPEDVEDLFDWHVHALAFAYKLFIDPGRYDAEKEDYFGLDGRHTEEIYSAHERAQEFWSHSGVDDDIRVLSAHGSDLADRHDKLVPTLEVMFGDSYNETYTVFDHADDIQELILRLPGGYNFPLLTFNAFATYESDQHASPSIVIGDGYFAFQRAGGLGEEGPEYALAHEHAHHLQQLLDGEGEEGESDRRKELLADALSAYFLAHDGGGDLSGEELADVHSVAYSLGDCQIGEDDHHGTPRERRCATMWGAALAGDPANEMGLDLAELERKFEGWYARLDGPEDDCVRFDVRADEDAPIPRGLVVATAVLGAAYALVIVWILVRIRVSRRRVAVDLLGDYSSREFRTSSLHEVSKDSSLKQIQVDV